MTTYLPALPLLRATAVAALCTFGTVTASAAAEKAKHPVAKSAHKAPAKPAEAPLAQATPEQQRAAEEVFYGAYQCEFNQTLDIEKNPQHAAYVDVKSGKSTWLMKPVLSSTGAIRLEDVKGETLMVQIASKSMLLNVKTARRIVDDCVSPKQRELIAAAKQARAAAEASGAPAEVRLLSGSPTATVAVAPRPATAASAAAE
jgi:hypothetical protein